MRVIGIAIMFLGLAWLTIEVFIALGKLFVESLVKFDPITLCVVTPILLCDIGFGCLIIHWIGGML